MADIAEIPGMTGPALGLFRAAGIETSGQLVVPEIGELMAILDEVNGEQRLVEELPAVAALEAWQSAARIFEGTAPRGAREVQIPPMVMAGIRASGLKVAELVPGKQLRAAGVEVSQVPVGRLVEEVVGGLRVVADHDAEDARERGAEDARERGAEDARERDRGGEAESGEGGSSGQAHATKSVQHLRAPLENKEEEPMEFQEMDERRTKHTGLVRRNLGMCHRAPVRVYLGALATLLSMGLAVAGFVMLAVTLAKSLFFESPVPVEEIYVLGVFPLALLIYLGFAIKPRCRLCGQRLFAPRQCHKHPRAHRSILGYLFAVALHVVVFRWFRCMLCGTKQRLKE